MRKEAVIMPTIRRPIQGSNEKLTSVNIQTQPKNLETIRVNVKRWHSRSLQIGTDINANTSFAVKHVMQKITGEIQVLNRLRFTNLGFRQRKNTRTGRLKVLMHLIKVGTEATYVTELDQKTFSTALKGSPTDCGWPVRLNEDKPFLSHFF